ncbi:hypothetical protein R1flu_026229 [Riccia fluitans]|uniref:Uncharacterized protein n=1 Tax=Riccia fluitans TaxID=41844 RepID=A0ABD1XFC5_9MARC
MVHKEGSKKEGAGRRKEGSGSGRSTQVELWWSSGPSNGLVSCFVPRRVQVPPPSRLLLSSPSLSACVRLVLPLLWFRRLFCASHVTWAPVCDGAGQRAAKWFRRVTDGMLILPAAGAVRGKEGMEIDGSRGKRLQEKAEGGG